MLHNIVSKFLNLFSRNDIHMMIAHDTVWNKWSFCLANMIIMCLTTEGSRLHNMSGSHTTYLWALQLQDQTSDCSAAQEMHGSSKSEVDTVDSNAYLCATLKNRNLKISWGDVFKVLILKEDLLYIKNPNFKCLDDIKPNSWSSIT